MRVPFVSPQKHQPWLFHVAFIFLNVTLNLLPYIHLGEAGHVGVDSGHGLDVLPNPTEPTLEKLGLS